ncbi:MAG: RecX family transcriptional regulator [Thermomicrobiales bacterium]|nr:RecX family transcriptional regulator [Thermomicrobiales bacterium]
MRARGDADRAPDDQCALPGRITSIATQSRRADRVNVFVGESYCFSCRAEVAVRLHLQTGMVLTSEIRDRALEEDAYLTAYAASIELLAHRGRSEREIRDRLRRKGHDGPVIDRVIARLYENRYLDDAEFARSWIENRATHRPRGDRALRQELRGKGVDAQVIDSALAGAELDQQAMANDAARKRAASLTQLEPDVQKRRLIGFLQRRGFSWEVIKPAVESALGPSDDAESAEFETLEEPDSG